MIFKVSYDTHTSTWDGYGKVWIGEAESYDAAIACAKREAAVRFPDVELRNFTVTETTPPTLRAYQVRQEQTAIWMANMAAGRPNGRGIL